MYVQKGPTEFASVPVYIDEESFHEESGWFEPAPADVSATCIDMQAYVHCACYTDQLAIR